MTESRPPISFLNLIKQCQRIEVPLIQRDYAQGRESQKDVRNDFLGALHGALLLHPGDSKLPLNLDFVYGSMESGNAPRFLPLDGQQRLTTLFLLHWYLAWRDGRLPDFKAMLWDGRHSRFAYTVRPSSTQFLDALVGFVPADAPDAVPSVRRMLEDQPWYFLEWRLDPTIQSLLTMLDAIHGRLRTSEGLYERLVDEESPAITFHVLPLEHFGLSDDLYIKMNARGKPLTSFETFKARFEQHLKEIYFSQRREIGGTSVPVYDFFARRMDTKWTDFFWSHRAPVSDIFDAAAMNLFWIVAWVSVEPNNRGADGPSVARYRQGVGAYSEFQDLGLLTKTFAENLICLLEAWSSGGGQLHPQLPDARYFDERAFFRKVTTLPSSLQYGDLVLFAAFISYLRINEGIVREAEFQDWMRVAFNLVQNSDIDGPDEFERSLSGLQKLMPHSREILPHLAAMEAVPLGFSREQLQEESLKARLMLAQNDWADRIHAAESHGYFRGQVGFLLEFSGTRARAEEQRVQDWLPAEHSSLQGRFDEYLSKAKLTFNERGLAAVPGEPHQWQRSLLAVGNYLVRIGPNYSFVTDPPSNPDSWKRFLRGGPSAASSRDHLKTLWDRLDLTRDIEPQLASIRDTSGLEPWRSAIVAHPQVIEYCSEREIRCGPDSNEIYLLKRRQMNGTHAELFSFVLHLDLETERQRLAPLQLAPYQSVRMTDTEPHVALQMGSASFIVVSADDQFRISVSRTELVALLGAEENVLTALGFIQDDTHLKRLVSRQDARDFLFTLAARLREPRQHGK